MPAGLPTLNLPDLGGYAGFEINSPVAIDTFVHVLDFNNDGIDDVALMSKTANSSRGIVYVVFGRSDGFDASLDLSLLDGTRGFSISGEANGDQFGASLGTGDFNGDGIGDLAIGAPGADPEGSNRGAVYIIHGRAAVTASLPLSTLNGSTGYKITGGVNGEGLGYRVVSGGDFNADGLEDILIGAPDSDRFRSNSGAAFLILGRSAAAAPTLSVNSLGNANGFIMGVAESGEAIAGAQLGSWVYFAGDLNGDGFDDLSVGSSDERELTVRLGSGEGDVGYHLFGRSEEITVEVNLRGLSAADGYRLTDLPPLELSNFGRLMDITGDGIKDYTTLGGFAGSNTLGYVAVPGKEGKNFASNPFLSSPLKVVGRLVAVSGSDILFASLGDFNGDGLFDYLVDPKSGSNAELYFGAKLTTLSVIGKTTTDQGIALTGLSSQGDASISFIGDINADGFDDLLMKVPQLSGVPRNFVLFGTGLRIAPDGKTATFREGDGDLITVKTTKGTFDYTQFAFAQRPGSVSRGQDLQRLDLALGGAEFDGAAITITAKKGPVRGQGDGQVDVGFLEAEGLDLAAVKIAGRLGGIRAGDADAADAGLGSLDVLSFGRAAGGEPVPASTVAGRTGKINVRGDFSETSFAVTGGAVAGVASFAVKGNFSGHLEVAGPLVAFKSRDFADGSTLTTHAAAKATALAFHEIGDGTKIEIAGPVGTLTAAQVGQVTIIADRIATLVVTGDAKAGLRGDFRGTLTLDHGGAAESVPTLGAARIAGLVQGAAISAAGSIGAVTVAAMENSSIFAGFTPTSPGDPLGGGIFGSATLLKALTVTGKVTLPGKPGVSFDSSFIVAARLGPVAIPTLEATEGDLLWGFGYRDTIKSLKVKTPLFTYDTSSKTTQELDDFRVAVLS